MSTQSREPVMWMVWSVVERLGALALLIVLAPLLILIGLATGLLSGASPLIAHRRLGFLGQPFWLLKFRTMWPRRGRGGNPFRLVEYIVDENGPRRKRTRDRRICSRFARFCRRHSIDELPQLWHVVQGQMSLVGPRPITAAEWEVHYTCSASELLEVKPGISGLWQIMGRSRLTYEQRRSLDLELVRNRSLKLYFRILMGTLPEVWSGRNAW
jgi:exopolysaccharide production protein ExoY